VVWDHAHLLLGIAPGETPEEAALALLMQIDADCRGDDVMMM